MDSNDGTPSAESQPGPDAEPADDPARARVDASLGRLPAGLQRWLGRLLDRQPGRIVLQAAAGLGRVEVFDRSMTIAAQFFTSVLPVLILIATLGSNSDRFADAIDMPEQSRQVLEGAVDSGGAAFGIVGAIFVLVSATSLSRALARAFAAIWGLPRPPTRLSSAWRWLAVVLVFALSLVLVRTAGEPLDAIPPRELWPRVVSFSWDVAVAAFVPWALLAGAVRVRMLAPGAFLFALLMITVRPATQAWLPGALEASADRYGSIGVAFTYLTWLYVAAFCFLTTALVGQVVATDPGTLGRRVRG
jgi:membrane protein